MKSPALLFLITTVMPPSAPAQLKLLQRVPVPGNPEGHFDHFAERRALPITKGVDDMVFDAASKRIYIAADDAADVYEQTDPDHYKLLGNVPTAPGAKTARLVPELNRYFVAAPKNGAEAAQILVFEVE